MVSSNSPGATYILTVLYYTNCYSYSFFHPVVLVALEVLKSQRYETRSFKQQCHNSSPANLKFLHALKEVEHALWLQ